VQTQASFTHPISEADIALSQLTFQNINIFLRKHYPNAPSAMQYQ
jgi:hypothetical protein